ncbi:MAG: hypothetical protein JWP81_1988 [Ferruginibacter sp.]|nr:hypothetical protein [Ferruginibacter sp.]
MLRRRKRPIITAVILMIAIGNYTRLTGNENIRAIQFLSIFVIGALSALLIRELAEAIRDRRNQAG